MQKKNYLELWTCRKKKQKKKQTKKNINPKDSSGLNLAQLHMTDK